MYETGLSAGKCQVKGTFLLFSKLNFITKYLKRLLYFLITILSLNCSQKDIGIIFHCRAPFQFSNFPSDEHNVKKAVDYDVPCVSSINDDWVYPCCGLFKLEKWEVCHHSCADIIQPYRWQLLESETAFCDICHKNCISPADFVLHQECVHLCLPLFACPICHFTYITHSCLCMHITKAHGGSRNSNFLSLIKIWDRIVIL